MVFARRSVVAKAMTIEVESTALSTLEFGVAELVRVGRFLKSPDRGFQHQVCLRSARSFAIETWTCRLYRRILAAVFDGDGRIHDRHRVVRHQRHRKAEQRGTRITQQLDLAVVRQRDVVERLPDPPASQVQLGHLECRGGRGGQGS